MKRNKFIATLTALATLPALSFSQLKKTSIRNGKGFKINVSEGRIHGHLKMKGVNSNILDIKISGSDTNGDLAIFEQTSLSPGRGTPLHVHHFQDEIFYILEGAYYFQVGEDKYNLTTGDSIFLPRKVPHAWTQVSEKGKMTVIMQPAGKLENFFVVTSVVRSIPINKRSANQKDYY
jgi:quercetin dioxygenase-like cupin family protein